MSKISIPKLNLEVLPNYHKKSEKCLNEALLAAYQQKHGANKVCWYFWKYCWFFHF